jgi:hypothetical protein
MALAPSALVLGAVERDHRAVDLGLILGIHADDSFGNLAIHRLDRGEHALAEIFALVAIAQFHRLMAPVDAPEGTAARPKLPSSSNTSTSTVGLPRLSRIWRAWTSRMAVIWASFGSAPGGCRPFTRARLASTARQGKAQRWLRQFF